MTQKWYSAAEVARMKNVVAATIIGHINDGTLEAVNVARRGSVRNRWRISEAMLQAFDERQTNKQPAAAAKQSGRTIERPKKDFFAEASR